MNHNAGATQQAHMCTRVCAHRFVWMSVVNMCVGTGVGKSRFSFK